MINELLSFVATMCWWLLCGVAALFFINVLVESTIRPLAYKIIEHTCDALSGAVCNAIKFHFDELANFLQSVNKDR